MGRMKVDTCTLNHNLAGSRGGGIFNKGVMLLLTSMLASNTAQEYGSALWNDYGWQISYVLPAPPGFWAPGTRCEVWRAPCEEISAVRRPLANCMKEREECSMNPTDNVVCGVEDADADCQPILPFQPCNWQTYPDILGKSSFTLPPGGRDDNLPYACSPGVLGGNGLLTSEQTGAACAGMCPAGFTCEEEATVKPEICPLGAWCPEGSTVAQPCKKGTYSNAIGLDSASGCTLADAGYYAMTGSTQPTPHSIVKVPPSWPCCRDRAAIVLLSSSCPWQSLGPELGPSCPRLEAPSRLSTAAL